MRQRYISPHDITDAPQSFIALRWPLDTQVPVIVGQWRREMYSIVAWYKNREELGLCVLLANAIMKGDAGEGNLLRTRGAGRRRGGRR